MRYRELRSEQSAESSEAIRGRVEHARATQLERFRDDGIYANAQMSTRLIRRHCPIDEASEKLLEAAITRMGLSARAHDRILKVARTIADLDGSAAIASRHIGEAVAVPARSTAPTGPSSDRHWRISSGRLGI